MFPVCSDESEKGSSSYCIAWPERKSQVILRAVWTGGDGSYVGYLDSDTNEEEAKDPNPFFRTA